MSEGVVKLPEWRRLAKRPSEAFLWFVIAALAAGTLVSWNRVPTDTRFLLMVCVLSMVGITTGYYRRAGTYLAEPGKKSANELRALHARMSYWPRYWATLLPPIVWILQWRQGMESDRLSTWEYALYGWSGFGLLCIAVLSLLRAAAKSRVELARILGVERVPGFVEIVGFWDEWIHWALVAAVSIASVWVYFSGVYRESMPMLFAWPAALAVLNLVFVAIRPFYTADERSSARLSFHLSRALGAVFIAAPWCYGVWIRL